MGVKRDPAIRLCVTCGQLKSPISLRLVDASAWLASRRNLAPPTALEDRTTPTPPSRPERETRRCGVWGWTTRTRKQAVSRALRALASVFHVGDGDAG